MIRVVPLVCGIAAAIFMVLVLAFSFQGTRGLWEPDEGYYVCTAQAMLHSGNYLVPAYNGEPFLDKPPLTYWGIAGGMLLLGENEWGARLFHALCFSLTACIVMLWGAQLYRNIWRGLLAGSIYATMLLPFIAGNVATPDTPLTLFTTLSFYCFWRAATASAARRWLWVLLFALALGGGFQAKGPAALIPTSGMLLYLIARRQAWPKVAWGWLVTALAVFFAVGFAWYAVMAWTVPGAAAYFWDSQIWGRLVSTKYGRHPGLIGACKVYLPILLLGPLPWSLLWLQDASRVFQLVRRGEWVKQLLNRPNALFLALGIVAPLIILCLASSKLPLYALPVFPLFSLALTPAAHRLLQSIDGMVSHQRLRIAAAAGCFWVLFLITGKAVVAYIPSARDNRALWQEISAHVTPDIREVVMVDMHSAAVIFYATTCVEFVTSNVKPYPFFVTREVLRDEVLENEAMPHHVAYVVRNSRQEYLKDLLCLSNHLCRETELNYQRKMLFCQ